MMGRRYIFYRLIYSFFAFISLALLLWYQFTIKSYLLFHNLFFQMAAGVITVLPGIFIMIVCIKKYFVELSGIQALEKKPLHVTLQQKGLHKYVRHPLYSGTLLFVWGLFILFPFLSNLIACVIMHTYVLIGIYLEEKKLRIEFGQAYMEYAKKVPKLIPFL